MADERSITGRTPDSRTPPTQRPVAGEEQPGEQKVDHALRPRSLDEMIGQDQLRDKMEILVEAARKRNETLDHVLLYGPPGLGKCITADSLILTGEGLIPFEDLLPSSLQEQSNQPSEVEVFGINGLEQSSHVYANGNGPTIRIRTRSGFEIEGTPNHPLLVATAAGPQWKPLALLAAGEYVAIGRGTEVWGRARSVQWQPDGPTDRRLRTEAAISHYHAELAAVLGQWPTITELHHTYARTVSGNPIPESTAKRLKLPLSDGRRVGQAGETWQMVAAIEPNPGRTIMLDADLGYLLGLLVGAGHFERGRQSPAFSITCGDDEILWGLQRICQHHFGLMPERHQYEHQTAQLCFSQTIGRVMLTFGAKVALAKDKVVPAAILQGPRSAAVGFLQGLFDTDGSVWPDGNVEFGTRSRTLAVQVQLLLANLGIIAHRTEKQVAGSSFWYLFIGGEDAVRFHTQVGFRLERKRQRQERLHERKRGWNRSDLVPGANQSLCALLDKSWPHARRLHKRFDPVKWDDRVPTRQQVNRYLAELPDWVCSEPEFGTLAALCNPQIYWDQVVSTSPSTAETFDFVVPRTHSFLANGFFNHNTTLSHILAHEMGGNLKVTAGPAVEKAGDLAAILTNLRKGDILFIDEIHRLGRAVEEILYPAMEDFALDIVVGSGPGARNIRLSLPKFTVVGATTRLALITAPLRARFGVVERFDFYEAAAVQQIITRAASLLEVAITDDAAAEIARRARGTPRVGLRLLRRVRDYALVRAEGHIDLTVAEEALATMLQIDWLGLDELDRRVLEALITKFNGGPVGLETLAASISEEADTIMDVVEPYLLQLGFLDRTPRGRIAMRAAYNHLGIPYPERPEQAGLFDLAGR